MIAVLAPRLQVGQRYVSQNLEVIQVRSQDRGTFRRDDGEAEDFLIVVREAQLQGLELTAMIVAEEEGSRERVSREMIQLARTRLRSPGERKK